MNENCPSQQQPWPEAGSVLILVDFSAIAYACWATAERAEEAGKASLAAHATVCSGCDDRNPHPECAAGRAIKQYDAHEVLKTNLSLKMATIEENTGEPPNRYTMVLDSHPRWKYDLFPGYKGDRAERFNPRPEAEVFLREAYPGMQWVRAPGNEADDAVAALVKANRAMRAIVIVTGDKDLWALLAPKVKIFNPITKKFLDLETVAAKFHGLEPQHIRLAKAFWGDNSDSIPNCCPRQQRQLVPLIKNSGGDIGRLGDLRSQVSDVCWQYLQANAQQIATNWRLVALNPDVELEWC